MSKAETPHQDASRCNNNGGKKLQVGFPLRQKICVYRKEWIVTEELPAPSDISDPATYPLSVVVAWISQGRFFDAT